MRNGSTLPVLALDHRAEVASALTNAYPDGSVPAVRVVDPRGGFANLPLVAADGSPLYSAIIVASDWTCGGCDNNDNGYSHGPPYPYGTGTPGPYATGSPGPYGSGGSTPDSDAINARTHDIARFFNAGGGILAFAGAENRGVFYSFLPIPVTAPPVTPPFRLNGLGLALGLWEGVDDNCCATHNSFQIPDAASPLKVVERDAAGLAETLAAGPTLATLPTVTPSPTSAPGTPTGTPGGGCYSYYEGYDCPTTPTPGPTGVGGAPSPTDTASPTATAGACPPQAPPSYCSSMGTATALAGQTPTPIGAATTTPTSTATTTATPTSTATPTVTPARAGATATLTPAVVNTSTPAATATATATPTTVGTPTPTLNPAESIVAAITGPSDQPQSGGPDVQPQVSGLASITGTARVDGGSGLYTTSSPTPPSTARRAPATPRPTPARRA